MTALAVSLGRATRGIDRVALAILAILAVLALLAPPQALEGLRFSAASLLEVAPFLLLSVGVAAYAKASGTDNLIARAFSGQLGVMVVFAALMGALSPFCSCGVIPLIAALLAMGVPLPPVMAFWLASPIMDPSMFVLTAGTLGMAFAQFKTAAAVGIGLLGGFGTMALTSAGWFDEPLRAGIGNGGCAGGKVRTPKPVVWRFWREPGGAARSRATGWTSRCSSANGWRSPSCSKASCSPGFRPSWLPARWAAVAGCRCSARPWSACRRTSTAMPRCRWSAG